MFSVCHISYHCKIRYVGRQRRATLQVQQTMPRQAEHSLPNERDICGHILSALKAFFVQDHLKLSSWPFLSYDRTVTRINCIFLSFKLENAPCKTYVLNMFDTLVIVLIRKYLLLKEGYIIHCYLKATFMFLKGLLTFELDLMATYMFLKCL